MGLEAEVPIRVAVAQQARSVGLTRRVINEEQEPLLYGLVWCDHVLVSSRVRDPLGI